MTRSSTTRPRRQLLMASPGPSFPLLRKGKGRSLEANWTIGHVMPIFLILGRIYGLAIHVSRPRTLKPIAKATPGHFPHGSSDGLSTRKGERRMTLQGRHACWQAFHTSAANDWGSRETHLTHGSIPLTSRPWRDDGRPIQREDPTHSGSSSQLKRGKRARVSCMLRVQASMVRLITMQSFSKHSWRLKAN